MLHSFTCFDHSFLWLKFYKQVKTVLAGAFAKWCPMFPSPSCTSPLPPFASAAVCVAMIQLLKMNLIKLTYFQPITSLIWHKIAEICI